MGKYGLNLLEQKYRIRNDSWGTQEPAESYSLLSASFLKFYLPLLFPCEEGKNTISFEIPSPSAHSQYQLGIRVQPKLTTHPWSLLHPTSSPSMGAQHTQCSLVWWLLSTWVQPETSLCASLPACFQILLYTSPRLKGCWEKKQIAMKVILWVALNSAMNTRQD